MKQYLTAQFCQDAEVVDKLTTQVSMLEDESRSEEADKQAIPSAIVQLFQDYEAVTNEYKQAWKLNTLYSSELDAKILELENRADERQQEHEQIIDENWCPSLVRLPSKNGLTPPPTTI